MPWRMFIKWKNERDNRDKGAHTENWNCCDNKIRTETRHQNRTHTPESQSHAWIFRIGIQANIEMSKRHEKNKYQVHANLVMFECPIATWKSSFHRTIHLKSIQILIFFIFFDKRWQNFNEDLFRSLIFSIVCEHIFRNTEVPLLLIKNSVLWIKDIVCCMDLCLFVSVYEWRFLNTNHHYFIVTLLLLRAADSKTCSQSDSHAQYNMTDHKWTCDTIRLI